MLENLIAKYKKQDVEEVVYRLSYGGKFLIVKGKTLAGSLIIIAGAYKDYSPDKERYKEHLYKKFYDHYNLTHIQNKRTRFTVKVLMQAGRNFDQLALLKEEEQQLSIARSNKKCLNASFEPYIPKYNESTKMYGWLQEGAVNSFKIYQCNKTPFGNLAMMIPKDQQVPTFPKLTMVDVKQWNDDMVAAMRKQTKQ